MAYNSKREIKYFKINNETNNRRNSYSGLKMKTDIMSKPGKEVNRG